MTSSAPGAPHDVPIALVTGTRKGLGYYLAQQLVAAGYQVVGCSREPVAWSLPGYTHVCTDVGDEQQVRHLMRHIQEHFGYLDVAINNAGIASMNHSLLTPVQTVDRILATNVRGAFLIARDSAKLMRKGKYGRIVSLSSIAVPMNLEGESIYAASKSAVESLTRTLAREVAGFGITVNAVGPTPIETDLIRGVPAQRIEALVQRLAIKRMGRPSDVWNVIEFLIRPQSDYITGQVIYLGGV